MKGLVGCSEIFGLCDFLPYGCSVAYFLDLFVWNGFNELFGVYLIWKYTYLDVAVGFEWVNGKVICDMRRTARRNHGALI